MKSKIILSSLVLFFFSLLAAGSTKREEENFATLLLVAFVGVILIAIITAIVKSINKKKRLQMIEKDERDSTDFDRSISIGDDRCKLYFDSAQKRVMIMQITTEGITKKYIDDFEYPGKNLTRFVDGLYLVYEPTTRRLLSGDFNGHYINEIDKLAGVDKSGLTTKEPIPPSLNLLRTTYHSSMTVDSRNIHVLSDEYHGLMAVVELGKLYAFNYIKAEKLSEKAGLKSTISIKNAGNYMFLMDSFFKVLVIIGRDKMHKSLNYSDIIEVSYIENGDQLFSKSTGRTVGGAIVGGVLMGGAGAVVGGLSGDSKQNKVVKNMDIKILLRNTDETSCILHFMDSSNPLKTKESIDKSHYEEFLNNANKAKDLLSVIIDDVKQTATQSAPVIAQPSAPQSISVADELMKLAKLKADGILTKEEFVSQKKLLLGGNVANKGHEDNNAVTASSSTKPTEERHICGVCGYIMDGETPDKCPMCKSPSTKFNVL